MIKLQVLVIDSDDRQAQKDCLFDEASPHDLVGKYRLFANLR